MTEIISKLIVLAIYLFGNTFDSVPISMCNMLKSKVVAVECSLGPRRSIDEQERVSYIGFLPEFSQKSLSERGGTRWIQRS